MGSQPEGVSGTGQPDKPSQGPAYKRLAALVALLALVAGGLGHIKQIAESVGWVIGAVVTPPPPLAPPPPSGDALDMEKKIVDFVARCIQAKRVATIYYSFVPPSDMGSMEIDAKIAGAISSGSWNTRAHSAINHTAIPMGLGGTADLQITRIRSGYSDLRDRIVVTLRMVFADGSELNSGAITFLAHRNSQ
jgi:hypothetical protein